MRVRQGQHGNAGGIGAGVHIGTNLDCFPGGKRLFAELDFLSITSVGTLPGGIVAPCTNQFAWAFGTHSVAVIAFHTAVLAAFEGFVCGPCGHANFNTIDATTFGIGDTGAHIALSVDTLLFAQHIRHLEPRPIVSTLFDAQRVAGTAPRLSGLADS